MDVLKLLTIGAAIIALVYDCDAQRCAVKERGKDLVREVKQMLAKFPRHWPGRGRWKTVCPVKKRFLKTADNEARFALAARTFSAYVELLKGIYLEGEMLYGKCSSTNKTRISLGRIQEKLDFVSDNASDRNIILTPATVEKVSAWRVLKLMQRFGKCVRDRRDNCSCAEKLFRGCGSPCRG